MADSPSSFEDRIDRRAFVKLAGASGAAALAGCSGTSNDGDGTTTDGSNSDSNDDSSSNDSDGKSVHDATHLSYTNQVPTKIQYNPNNPTSYAQISHYLLFDRFATFNFASGEFVPYLIQDWQFGDGTFELSVRDGVTWDDGDDVTADDVATQLRLQILSGGAISKFTESVDVPDDSTVVLNLSGKVNPRIVEINVLGQRFMTQKQSHFQSYVDKFAEDADAAQKDLQSYAYKDVIPSGPFRVKRRGNQEILLERRDDHPDSENINFSQYAFRFLDGNTAVHQAIGAMQLDSVFSVFAPPNVVKNFPDSVQMEGIPSKWGYGLVPNHDHEHLGDRAVRQAIQYVLDRKTIVDNVGSTLKQVPPLPVGIPSSDQKRWLGDAYDSFNDYGADSQMTDKATQVLEDAGYSKNGGTWQDSSGNPVEIPVTVPSGWSDWITATQTIVDQLSSFGFKSEVDARNFGSLLGTAWPSGDFVLSAGGWLPGGGRAAFPYFSLHHQLVENFRGFTYNYPAANENRGGSNGDVTVPAREGSGDLTTNPTERLAELSKSTDDATTKEIIVEQAWVTNVDLPFIPVMEKQEQTFINTKNYDVPEEGSDVSQVRWANTWLPRQGEMQFNGN